MAAHLILSPMRPARVQLLVTCLVDRFFPGTGDSVVTLLEKAGVTVSVPAAQTCCGQPAFNAGYDAEARTLARHTIDVLSASDDPIVVPSGSCGDMVIHQYVALLGDDPEYGPKARAIAARTYELTVFLTRILGVTDLGATASGTLSYHACCHGLRGLGVDSEPKALLAQVKGAAACPLPEAEVCCGFGGLFAVKMADISAEMLKRKLDAIEACGADTIAVTDVSCGMHMNGGLRRRGSPVRVVHIADVLAGATSGETK
jgi:L-lactate dehydrogenase complex protein LldE